MWGNLIGRLAEISEPFESLRYIVAKSYLALILDGEFEAFFNVNSPFLTVSSPPPDITDLWVRSPTFVGV